MTQCKSVVLIDNKDSFVYNLARYVEELGVKAQVYRHDKITVKALIDLNPSHLIISPGPCGPEKAGVSVDAVIKMYQSIPILGVCLGHQAIARAFGAKVEKASQVAHGKPEIIEHSQTGIFQAIPNLFQAARYHSLHVSRQMFPRQLEVTATNKDGMVMAVQHKTYPTYGLQFHPESILTQHGHGLLENFLFKV